MGTICVVLLDVMNVHMMDEAKKETTDFLFTVYALGNGTKRIVFLGRTVCQRPTIGESVPRVFIRVSVQMSAGE